MNFSETSYQSSEQDNNNEPLREVYYLKNFIGFFEKRNIRLKTVYLLDDRIVFLHVSYGSVCSDLWIYVTSEHDISAEGTQIPKIKLIQNDEDYKLPPNSAMIKDYLVDHIELMQNGKIKLLNAGKKFIVYITRHNEVDFFELCDSPIDKGFYFVTEWKYFFDNSKDIPLSVKRLEELIIETAYEHLQSKNSEVLKSSQVIRNTVDCIPLGMECAKQLTERSKKLDKLFDQNNQSREKSEQKSQSIQQLSSSVRLDNLQKAFQTFMITESLSKLNKIF